MSRRLRINCFMDYSITKMQNRAIKEANVKALVRVIVYIMIDLCNIKYSANYNIANISVVNFL